MPGRRTRPLIQAGDDLPPLPVDAATWIRLLEPLRLPPQPTRAVELLHRGLRYEEIAAVMGISTRTVRDHLDEVKKRLGAADHVEIILDFFTRSHALQNGGCGRHK